MKEEPKEFRELREKWSELGWKDCYNMFMKEAEEVCDILDLYMPVIFPEFEENEIALLDMICEVDKNFEGNLKDFYSELYELIVLLKKREEVSFYHLFLIGEYWGRIWQRFFNLVYKEGRYDIEKIVDDIIEKMHTTLQNISIEAKNIKKIMRSGRRKMEG